MFTKTALGSSLAFLSLGTLLSVLLQIFPQPWISAPLQRLYHSRLDEPIVSTQILSTDPLLLYVHDFISHKEIRHLLDLGEPLFQRSMIKDGVVSTARTSESCFLPGNDTIVARVKHRAEHLMGGLSYDGMEAVQLVRYIPGQKVNLHFDWAQKPKIDRQGREYNRLASFFVYLKDDCTGGETWFPNVTVKAERKAHIAHGKAGPHKDGDGLSVRPNAGSGLFWINLKEDGSGDRRTLHAGLPVGEGMKVGMNIWVKKLL